MAQSMNYLSIKIKIRDETELTDQQIVDECMGPLMEKYPTIKDYVFMRDETDGWVHILIYGDFIVV